MPKNKKLYPNNNDNENLEDPYLNISDENESLKEYFNFLHKIDKNQKEGENTSI